MATIVALPPRRMRLRRRRRVGGRDWAERRLFDQVRAVEADFVLMREAHREVREICCDGRAASRRRDITSNRRALTAGARPNSITVITPAAAVNAITRQSNVRASAPESRRLMFPGRMARIAS